MREYKIVRKVEETPNVLSFYLAARDGQPLQRFRSGQWLKVDIPGVGERSYLLSAFSQDPRIYRITVADDGSGSSAAAAYWRHQLTQGDVVNAVGPTGSFHLPEQLGRPIMCLASGIGESFLVAAAEELAVRSSGHRAVFLYSTFNSRTFGLKTKLESLRSELRNSNWAIWYSDPDPRDREGRDFHHHGEMDISLCMRFLSSESHDVFACGPDRFIQWIEQELRARRILSSTHFAPLGKSSSVRPAFEERNAVEPLPARSVHFKRSGISAVWTQEQGTLLDLANTIGLQAPFSCRTGICGTCAQKIISGNVIAIRSTHAQTIKGEELLCSSVPASDLEIDL